MRILVTGSSGHLGEAIIRTLQKKNTDCIGIDINPSGYTSLVGSIADPEFVNKSMIGIDVIVHTATLHKTYAAEQKTGTILNIFSLLTIFVACLGLFGLATYTAEQRTKEIGIRKVLGATVTQLTQMLTREFLKLVLIASLIAFPVAWWVMHAWLQSFAYRISFEWWVFAMAAGIALLIALLTVSFQAIRAAIANPVTSLRSE